MSDTLLQRDLSRIAASGSESDRSARIILYCNSPKTITPVGAPMNTFPLAIMGVMYLFCPEKLSRPPAWLLFVRLGCADRSRHRRAGCQRRCPAIRQPKRFRWRRRLPICLARSPDLAWTLPGDGNSQQHTSDYRELVAILPSCPRLLFCRVVARPDCSGRATTHNLLRYCF